MGEMRNKYRQLESHVMELKAEITNKDGNGYYWTLSHMFHDDALGSLQILKWQLWRRKEK